MQSGRFVSLPVKVIKINVSIEVKPGLRKQDVIVVDNTGQVKVTLWQDHIDSLKVGQSYYLENMSVRTYNNLNYLTPSMSYSVKALGEPMQDVVESIAVGDDLESPTTLIDAEIGGVGDISKTQLCLLCKGTVTAINDTIGKCNSCTATVHLSKCSIMLRSELIIHNGNSRHLQAFGEVIQAIIGDEIDVRDASLELLTERLLMSQPFKLTDSKSEKIIIGILKNTSPDTD